MKIPLIMAVEPDPSRRAQLSSMFSRQFRRSWCWPAPRRGDVEAAGRIPELVLTSALIPPKDETELIAWLRGLGSADAHVQTGDDSHAPTAPESPSS